MDISLLQNGKQVCSSEAIYGADEAMKGIGGAGADWVTIKDMSICSPFKVRKGDILALKSSYDFDKHPR